MNTTQKFSLVSVELFFYVCPPISNAIGSTGRNGAFGIDFNMAVPYSWSISSKTRNKLIHSMNGNVVKLTDFFPRKKKKEPSPPPMPEPEPETEPVHRCHVCSREFQNRTALLSHMRSKYTFIKRNKRSDDRRDPQDIRGFFGRNRAEKNRDEENGPEGNRVEERMNVLFKEEVARFEMEHDLMQEEEDLMTFEVLGVRCLRRRRKF